MSSSYFDKLCGEKLYCWGNQEFGLYANLLGIPVLLFEENSAGEYLRTMWRNENENLYSARGIGAGESRTRIFNLQGIKNYVGNNHTAGG